MQFNFVVAGSQTSNGSLCTEQRMSIPVAVKPNADRRSGIPADFPEHSEPGDGKTVSPPDMATEKKRGIFSMFRRKKDSKEIKQIVVILPICMLIHILTCQNTRILLSSH